jgi:two-component system, response regulator PdtaR
MASDGEGARIGNPETAMIVVLVVDDEFLVRMMASDILIDGGYHVLEAGNAAEALILIDAHADIGLIFTDVDMPGDMNGLGLAHLIHTRTPRLPIIVTSGATLPGVADLPGSAKFLPKPYSYPVLIGMVQRLTGTAEMRG